MHGTFDLSDPFTLGFFLGCIPTIIVGLIKVFLTRNEPLPATRLLVFVLLSPVLGAVLGSAFLLAHNLFT